MCLLTHCSIDDRISGTLGIWIPLTRQGGAERPLCGPASPFESLRLKERVLKSLEAARKRCAASLLRLGPHGASSHDPEICDGYNVAVLGLFRKGKILRRYQLRSANHGLNQSVWSGIEVRSLRLPVSVRCASKLPINDEKMPGSSSRRNGIGRHIPIVTRPSRAMRCAAYIDSAALVATRSRTAPPMCWVSATPAKSTAPSFPASNTSRRSRWAVARAVGRWP